MWTWRIVLCLSFAAAALADGGKPSKVVKTTSGAVRGYQDPTSGVYEFIDIPYATAPTGPNKFKAPLPAPTWQHIRDAVDTEIICPQANLPMFEGFTNKTKDENCLLATVITPDSVDNKLPVVVYVHGGAFQIGYGSWLKPIDLVREHNIVAVTFNYRLGVHGFLCLGTADIPGNAGMKDQVALLRWVKKNIANFGGNPEDITIAGFSAGSAAVDLLMLSNSAQGLFNKVIPESGGNIAAFTIQSDPLETAKWFAKTLQFNNADDIGALEQFYKTLSYEQMLSNPFLDRTDSTFVFSPCVERSFPDINKADKEVFLDKSPTEIIKQGEFIKVPLLYGFAQMEGLLRLPFFDMWKDKMNENFSEFLPADLKFNSETEKEKVSTEIKEFYFGKNAIDNGSILAYIDYFTDVLFAYPMLRAVKLQVEDGHDQIYLYEYTFVDEHTPIIPHTQIRGATHCAQTMAVFGTRMFELFEDNLTLSEEFNKMSIIIRQIWANFIKTGKPVLDDSDLPKWPPVSGQWSPHMSLGKDMQLKGSLLLERTLFWDEIYSKYYREPVPPPAPPAKHSEL